MIARWLREAVVFEIPSSIGGIGSLPRRCIFQEEAAACHHATRLFHPLEPMSWPGLSTCQTREDAVDPLRKHCSSLPPSSLRLSLPRILRQRFVLGCRETSRNC